MMRQRGLTLIEMLVVLMIAGMALALGYQSLSQWRIAETSLSGVSDDIRRQRLGQAWFEASIRALVPIAEEPFAGDARSMTGYSLSPVMAPPGGTTRIRWSVEEDDTGASLVLEEDGAERLRLPLGDARDVRFQYLDPDGEPHLQWPPALGMPQHLPAGIALVREGDGPTGIWSASVSGNPDPPLIPPRYEPGSDE